MEPTISSLRNKEQNNSLSFHALRAKFQPHHGHNRKALQSSIVSTTVTWLYIVYFYILTLLTI